MLPKVPKGFITNFPNAVPDFIGPRQFIFLLSVVSVLILTSFFLVTNQNPSKKSQDPQYFSFLNQMRQDAQLIQFPSSHLKNRYKENLDVATNEKDSQKQFEALSSNFDILSGLYSATHNPQIREKAQKLGDFMRGVFPNSQGKFTVPCLDSTCGKLAYSQEEEEILTLASEATFKDPKSKEDLFRNMESAALTSGDQQKSSYYDSAFRIVQADIKEVKDSDSKLKDLAEKLKGLIKELNPEVYEYNSGIGLYDIE
ncbi:hypothetical protein A2W15_06225 [Candidatus Woesebacteria bacterium RBG_16_41_13]|nr:MAG: hypothetical protein A2W15_06225 [Candidatus Woesebacteria bacterium RBG_16_41_13]